MVEKEKLVEKGFETAYGAGVYHLERRIELLKEWRDRAEDKRSLGYVDILEGIETAELNLKQLHRRHELGLLK